MSALPGRDPFDTLSGAIIRLFVLAQQLADRLDKLEAAPRRRAERKPKPNTAEVFNQLNTPPAVVADKTTHRAEIHAAPPPEKPVRLTRDFTPERPDHPLRRWRRTHDISLDRTAEWATTTRATISRIETGRQYPRPDLLARLVEMTEGAVSAAAFFDWFAAAGPAK